MRQISISVVERLHVTLPEAEARDAAIAVAAAGWLVSEVGPAGMVGGLAHVKAERPSRGLDVAGAREEIDQILGAIKDATR